MIDFKKAKKFLSSPVIFFWAVLWLMIVLVVGTIQQKYIGLYQSQQIYFFSTLIWVGPLPVPGGYPTMIAIFINLSAKLIFASPFSWRKAGTLIVHLGAMLLLFGAFLTAEFSQEGNMFIYEKGSSTYFSDFHQRELVVFDSNEGEEFALTHISWNELKKGSQFKVEGTPITIEIVKVCKNCEMFPRESLTNDPLADQLRGRAKQFDMKTIAINKEDEQNRSGIVFKILGTDTQKDGIYFAVDFIELSPWVEVEGKRYNIALRRKRTYLPFRIKLIDFEKKYYPGTGIPKSFQSEIILTENEEKWRSVIKMNEPLRYKGYTFFQASFADDGEREATVLAVVKNVGRSFPYISSIVMCLGLFFHLIINLPRLIKRS